MSVVQFYWLVFAILLAAGPAVGQTPGNAGSQAPEFPPGKFSDGKQYRLADLRGKVVVLFFYESKCPRCKGTIRSGTKWSRRSRTSRWCSWASAIRNRPRTCSVTFAKPGWPCRCSLTALG